MTTLVVSHLRHGQQVNQDHEVVVGHARFRSPALIPIGTDASRGKQRADSPFGQPERDGVEAPASAEVQLDGGWLTGRRETAGRNGDQRDEHRPCDNA